MLRLSLEGAIYVKSKRIIYINEHVKFLFNALIIISFVMGKIYHFVYIFLFLFCFWLSTNINYNIVNGFTTAISCLCNYHQYKILLCYPVYAVKSQCIQVKWFISKMFSFMIAKRNKTKLYKHLDFWRIFSFLSEYASNYVVFIFIFIRST